MAKNKKKRNKTLDATKDMKLLAQSYGPEAEKKLDEFFSTISEKHKAQKRPKVVHTSDNQYDYSYTQNRELSWLRFNERVLDESFDESVPLFERLKFISIFNSNLDEFFMVRIGGLSDLADLKHQPIDNKSGLTPTEQIALVNETLPSMIKRAEQSFFNIEMKLADYGIERLTPESLHGDDKSFVERYFNRYLSPIISPLVIDPRHPFPNMHNGSLYLVCSVEGNNETGLIGLVEIPSSLDAIVEIPSPAGEHTFRYILLADVIRANVASCFGSYIPTNTALMRVTRNADIDPDGEGVEEEEDYRQHMKRILKKRLRLQPVRLEISGKINKSTLKTVLSSLELTRSAVTQVKMPLDIGYIFALEDKIPLEVKSEIIFPPFEPQPSDMFIPGKSMRSQVLEGDKLLFYPYQSMDTLLDLISEAAHDPECISIRITLYRVAKKSRLCESLIAAAEAGKEITVLMELRARFDEENNIEWAERLEDAGCTVIYGSEGFKCHSKICHITYKTPSEIQRITLLGTGNFNEKTAKLYSDFMLMTAHPGIAKDATAFFRNLSLGNLRGNYHYLGVAPAGLKPLILNGLNREIERARAGKEAYVFFKLNSLTDREVIDKIAEASQAGVKVDMIIRGISCLLPTIEGKTGNVTIRSIVGRFLEHARVYSFGVNSDMVYLSSADMMTRNTEHRVEIAYPVLDPTCRALVRKYMHYQLHDNVKARVLNARGTWDKIKTAKDEEPFNSQERLLDLAYDMAHNAQKKHLEFVLEAVQEAIEEDKPLPSKKKKKAHQQDVAFAPVSDPVYAPAHASQVESEQANTSSKDFTAEKSVSHVAATLIEVPEDISQDSSTSGPSRQENKKEQTALVKTARTGKKSPGRIRTGFSMIGMGLKTLFMGSDEERKMNRAKAQRKH